VTTIDGAVTSFDGHEDSALSSDAALASPVEVVSALVQFLHGPVLSVFAYGVYTLRKLLETEDSDWWPGA
jgi:hypothetical protein